VTAPRTVSPTPDFRHLLAMTDARGTFEHARLSEPRPANGYCTDDVARVLLVATRQPDPAPAIRDLARRSLRFLGDAQAPDGRYRNRLSRSGQWEDQPGLEDCWGRSVWALGTAAAGAADGTMRTMAMAQFDRAARQRSPWPRAMAFAALGAAEVLTEWPDHAVARDLLMAVAAGMQRQALQAEPALWPWPEERLRYANAVVPDAMIAAGAALEKPRLLGDGLALLGWLLEHESSDGHLSVTPAGGAGPGDRRPGFDQQPIEVAALADACARAAAVDRDPRWARGVTAAAAWFMGDNDGQRVMWDPATGGGFDGLHADRVNLNQGAESTLALVATFQHAQAMRLLAGSSL